MAQLPPNERSPENSQRGSQLVLRASEELLLAPESSIVAPEERTCFWKQPAWERLWLAVYRMPWQSLALVPAGNTSPEFTLEIAVALVYTGSLHLGEPVRLVDGTNVPLSELKQFVDDVGALGSGGARVIVAVGPLRARSTGAAVARAADLALLCVPLEVTKTADARGVIEEVGAERFVGSVVFRL